MRALSTAMPVALDPKSVAIASGVNREAGGVDRKRDAAESEHFGDVDAR